MAVRYHAGQARAARHGVAEHPLAQIESHHPGSAPGELPGGDAGSGAAIKHQLAGQRAGGRLELVVGGVRVGGRAALYSAATGSNGEPAIAGSCLPDRSALNEHRTTYAAGQA